ncbi:MAG: methylmalonyl-CoA epimerase [Sulfolobales archaeon]|nr:methylmalonyl-CoA epimerase [Sulfolobales archaeon]MDW8082591.1 methylmalonyl-CoA epimerase [Sulfolobales archaeon]
MKIDHIGIAVRNLDEAVKFYKEVLGLELVKIEEVPEERVRVAMFRVGESYIELLQGTDPESAITKFIEKRGEGIHHISIHVDDVDAKTEELKAKGVAVIYEKPREVAHGERKINFIHPKSTFGVLLEIMTRRGGY